MNKKSKIAVIGLKGLPAFGGAATVGENIINQLHEEYDFTVYSVNSHTNHKTGDYKGICHQIVFKSIKFKKLNTLLYYIKAAIHVVFSNYDLVHLHHRDAAFIVPFMKLFSPVILTTHGIMGTAKKWRRYKWFLQMQLKYFVKYSDEVTCVAKNEQRILKKKYNINAVFIPNGINSINGSKLIDTTNEDQYLCFAAGRIIECKGLDLILTALKDIDNPPKLKIIGDLEQEPEYKLKIEKLAEGLNVEFCGLLKEKSELFKIISQSKLFIFPSRQEAMSIMLLEVVSLKIPIVASNIIENRDVFDDTEVVFFESNNTDSLKKSLEYSLSSPIELLKMKEKAFLKLKSNYLWEDIAKTYSCQYNKLLP